MGEHILEHFKLSDWIKEDNDLLSKMAKVFDNDVEYDFYDVRREQIEFLYNHSLLTEEQKSDLFASYYVNGEKNIIAPFFDKLKESDKDDFNNISPYRKRAFSEIIVNLLDNDNPIEILPGKLFTQDSDDYRKIPRKFAEINQNLLTDSNFLSLLKKIAGYIREKAGRGTKFKFEFHVMRLLVNAKAKSNTPEGKHQDGADYIIMFITKRSNVNGGISKVYAKNPNGSFELKKQMLLEAHEGLFMSDASSNLYHEVTAVTPIDQSKPGIRDLFGFDISIVN